MKRFLSLSILISVMMFSHPAAVVKAVSGVVGSGTAASCTEAALRQAVGQGGSITFNCGPNPVTILINAEIFVPRGTTINGDGKITIDAQNNSRIFRGSSEAVVTLLNLTLQNGWVNWVGDGHAENGRGAALIVGNWSQVHIDNVKFLNNSAMASAEPCAGGGAIWFAGYTHAKILNSTFSGNFSRNGGAINSLFTDLTIYNSVFENNQAMHNAEINQFEECGGGGALYIDGANPTSEGGSRYISISKSVFRGNQTNQHGGGIVSFLYSNDQMIINESIFENNSAIFYQGANQQIFGGTGGGIWHGGEFTDPNRLYTGKLILTNSTLSGNHADYIGGGLWAFRPVALTNVTVTGNSASNDLTYAPSDIYKKGLGGGMTLDDGSSLTNVTITNNTAGYIGGGIAVLGARSSVNAAMANTIIANNRVIHSNIQLNCTSHLVDLGGNIQYPGKGTNTRDINCSSVITVSDPKVSDLADNGGWTKTVALQSGSPAVNIGVSAMCPARDQRSYIRNDRCDSGAYEFNGEPFVPSDWMYLSIIRR